MLSRKQREFYRLAALSTILAAVFLFFDLSLTLGVAGGVPYVAVVLVGWWFPNRNYIYLLAAISTVLTVAGYFFSPVGGLFWVVITNRSLAFFAIWITAFLLALAKRANDRVRASQDLLQSVVDTVPHWIYIKNEASRYVMVNRAFAEFHGMAPDQFIGVHTKDVPGRTAMEYEAYLESDHEIFEAKKSVVSVSDPVVSHDGEIRIFKSVKTPLKDAQDRISGLVGISEDVTEQKQAEDALRESEEKFRLLVENSIQGIAVYNLNEVLFANQAMADILGYDRAAELNGKNWVQLHVPPDERSNLKRLYKSVLQEEEPSGHAEVHLARKDGKLVLVDRVISAIEWNGSSVAMETALDITERKQLEAQFQQAQKMEAIGVLSGGIAHNFNNLLQMVLLNLEVLQSGFHDGDSDFEIITKMTDRIRDGADLTKGLLAYSKERLPDLEVVDVSQTMAKTAKLFAGTRKDIELHENYSAESVHLEINESELEQLLLNLFVNAGQAMPKGGELFLQTEKVMVDERMLGPHKLEPGNYAKISVRDTGAGMNKETQERMFDPFFTTKESGLGTGLGLSSVYGIVINHKGKIVVDSEVGSGTSFCIFLPITEATVKRSAPSSAKIREGRGTLLLVDDDEAITATFQLLFEGFSYQVLVANSGNEAVEIFRKESAKIDLVILDMTMPEMSGGEVFAKLKELDADLKVIVTSGRHVGEVESEDWLLGISGFIQKPFRAEELNAKIREVLNFGNGGKPI